MSDEGVAAEPAFRPGLAFAGIFAVTFCGLLAVGAVLPVLPRFPPAAARALAMTRLRTKSKVSLLRPRSASPGTRSGN